MSLIQALRIVLELAEDNALDREYYQGDSELTSQAILQRRAIARVESFANSNFMKFLGGI